MKSHINQLDTKRFGFNIARVDQAGDLLTGELIPALKSQNVALIITRTDGEKLDEINALEDMGFRIKDIQSTWRLHPAGQRIDQPSTLHQPSTHIRQATPDDIPSLRRIAATAFDNYGHYFADNRLDKDHCREIYPDWAARTLTDPTVADIVFVATTGNATTGIATAGNHIAGFLALKIEKQEQSKYATVAIGAVAAEFRRQNIYSTLVIASLAWCQANNLSWQEHQVLAVNYPVIRVLTKLDFRQVRSFVTLHCWLTN
jgi:hypothetical protein